MCDDNRKFKKDEMIKILNETTAEITKFKNGMDIDENKRKILDVEQMINQLRDLEEFIKKLESNCSDEVKNIKKLIKQTKESKCIELTELIDVFLEVVRANLADQVKMIPQDELNKTLPLQMNLIENRDSIVKKGKKEEQCDEFIGTMKIFREDSDLMVTIEIGSASKDENKFKIKDPYRVYPVVNCINTKYSYIKTDEV